MKKIPRALEFNLSPWLKSYIDLNTQKRTDAKNSFKKGFFKLMNDSVFGKTMENIRKRSNVKLDTDSEKLVKIASKPTYVGSKIFNEDLVGVNVKRPTIKLNRPSYVGMCILDLSKTLMYDFHYNYIKKKYNYKAKLLFTDTDSLTYEIQTEDVYADFYQDKHLFDNSDYSSESQFSNQANENVIGKFKDEAGGKVITEFIGLKSKMYSYIRDDGCNNKTAKGVKKNIIQQNIKHQDYKDTLFKSLQIHSKMKSIRSDHHQLASYELNKVFLSCLDDKRYIKSDGISSYAYGHYQSQYENFTI